ncbi:MAG: hypothetical protein LBE12_07520 [Planctomycetaceae bacterium]|nr:hypothetical protein [Planctomycetaceae bacterium]
MLPQSLVLKLYQPDIDWNKIDSDVKNYLNSNDYGITTEKRNPKIIVSLTSYPARIPRIHYTIISLLQQSVKPDEIILWLGKEQFPNKNNDLPNELIKLIEHGLTIKYCKDIRSYKKLIPALREYPEDVIVTSDDDVFYMNNWLEILLNSYKQNQTIIHCHRAHKIMFTSNGDLRSYNDWKGVIDYKDTTTSYINFMVGVGGVLYPPHTLHSDVTNESLFMKLSPSADDVWFWAMAVINEAKICVVKNNITRTLPNIPLEYNDLVNPGGLCAINVIQCQNDVQIKQVLKHYPQILEQIQTETKQQQKVA